MARLNPTATVETFFETLKKSSLLSQKQLDQAQSLARQTSDPKSIARALVKQNWLTAWQAAQLLAGWHQLHIGKYTLCNQIGKGTLGRTFLGKHSQLGRPVVIKTLSSRHTKNAEIVKQFLNDARHAASLDHRNIIHVYDVDSDLNRYFVVTEYAEGSDLQKLVDQQGPLPDHLVARYAQQVADGLAYAHEQGVVHRDIKPANLLLDKHGTIKILDLGVGSLAARTEHDSGLGYTPPEQTPEAEPGDPRDDIYALGRTCFFLATGKPPAEQSGTIPEFSPTLAELLNKMTAPRAEERFPTAEALLEAIDQWIADNPPPETSPPDASLPDAAALSGLDSPEGKAAVDPNPQFDWTPEESKPNDASASEEEVEVPLIVAEPRTPPGKKKSDSGAQQLGLDRTGKSASTNQVNDRSAGAKTTQDESQSGTHTTAPSQANDHSTKTPTDDPNRRLWIVGGIATVVVLLLLLLGTTVAWFAFGGRSNNPSHVAQQAVPSTPPEPADVDPEADGDDPGRGLPATAADVEAEAGREATGEEGLTLPEQFAELSLDEIVAGAATETYEANLETAPDENSEDQPLEEEAATPGQEEAVEQVLTAQDSGEPGQQEGSVEETISPASPPDETAGANDAETEDPFRDLPATVTLPPTESNETVPLGTVYNQPSDFCILRLKGAQHAVRGEQAFTMRNARAGTAERDWEISIADTVVAQLSLHDENLNFRWTDSAASVSEAEFLRNCVLNIHLNRHSHELVLRQPGIADPIPLNLDRPASTVRLPIESAPNPDRIRIDISGGEHLPNIQREPDRSIRATDGTQSVLLGESGEQALSLKIDARMRGMVQLQIEPQIKLASAQAPQRFQASQLRRFREQLNRTMLQTQAQLQQLKAANERFGDNTRERNRSGIPAQIQLHEQSLERLEAAQRQLQQIDTLLNATHQGRLNFRIYYQADDVEVELLRSSTP